MLQTIDKYIIKKYLSSFFFTALIFTMVAMIIDFSERIDDFLEEDVSIEKILTEYYLNFVPQINAMLWPLYALISVIFFTSRMASNSEIISILNSGASFTRIMRPFLIAATIIASLHWVGNHFFIPRANKVKVNFENQYVFKHDQDSKFENIHIFLDSTHKIYIRYYSKTDSVAHNFGMEQIENGKLVSKLNSRVARWNTQTKTWRIEDAEIRTFNGLLETRTFVPHIDTAIFLTPTDLERRDNLKTTMPTGELVQFIERERQRGYGSFVSFWVERYRRDSEPFTILILTCIGMAVSARKVRGGLGLNLAVGALVGGVFIVMTRFSATLSVNAGLTAFLGAWLPNFLFIAVVVYLIKTAQK